MSNDLKNNQNLMDIKQKLMKLHPVSMLDKLKKFDLTVKINKTTSKEELRELLSSVEKYNRSGREI